MKKFHNESGITLAELLATLAIASIVLILTISLFVAFNKQYSKQSDEIHDLTNVSTAVQAITKNIRSALEVEVNSDKDAITITLPEETITYALVNDTLEKNNHVYLNNVHSFDVENDGDTITLEIHGSANQKVKTTIVLRKGGE